MISRYALRAVNRKVQVRGPFAGGTWNVYAPRHRTGAGFLPRQIVGVTASVHSVAWVAA